MARLPALPPADADRDAAAAIRLIVSYKLLKAAVQLALALVLVVVGPLGLSDDLRLLATTLRDHAVHGWSLAVSTAILRLTSAPSLHVITLALFLDGALTLVEGWSLHRRRWWAPWLIVVANTTLVPFELVGIARHVGFGRIVLLVINLAIVAYMVRLALRHKARFPQP